MKKDNRKIVPADLSKVTVITPLNRLVGDLVTLRTKIKKMEDKFKEKMEPMKRERDELQARIIDAFHDSEQFSARFQGATASLAVRKTAQVVDEQAVIAALKSRGLTDYYGEQLNDLFTNSLAKEIAKGAIELPGVEVREHEYLSIRTSEAEERRKVTAEPFHQLK